jgi:threonine dehydrogenase-like Zn-dependent dehydrogenase
MRQAIMTAPGAIEMRSVPDARAGEGQVLLRITRIGVCGSDVHVYHGTHPFVSYPVVQGHEFFAVVEAVGEGVAGIRPGMKVTATPQEVCGACRPCRRGHYNVCENLVVRGFKSPGSRRTCMPRRRRRSSFCRILSPRNRAPSWSRSRCRRTPADGRGT